MYALLHELNKRLQWSVLCPALSKFNLFVSSQIPGQNAVSRAAALATGCQLKTTIIGGTHDLRQNKALGDELAVCQRIDAHRAAGADHVVLEVVTEDARLPPFDAWRRLASALT